MHPYCVPLYKASSFQRLYKAYRSKKGNNQRQQRSSKVAFKEGVWYCAFLYILKSDFIDLIQKKLESPKENISITDNVCPMLSFAALPFPCVKVNKPKFSKKIPNFKFQFLQVYFP